MTITFVLPGNSGSPALKAIFWFAYLAWIGSEIWIFARDRRRATGRSADRGSLAALVLLIGGGIALAFSFATMRAWAIDAPAAWFVVPGAILMVLGVALRLWAVRTLGRFFRVAVFTHDDHELIGTGPYRRLRNPSYTGTMITVTGFVLTTGNALSMIAGIGLPLIGFVLRIRIEERSLSAHFGEPYERFRSTRWALMPPIW